MSSLTKSRPDVVAAVQQLSTPKRLSSPVFMPARAVDNSPTRERMAKGDYEGRPGKRRRSNTVQALHMAGDIDGEAVSAAEQWFRDYAHANSDYLDIANEPMPDGYIKGDVHTWALGRGKAGERISLVREVLGLCAHVRFELMLAQGLSFASMAQQVYPNIGRSTGSTRIAAQCAAHLSSLPNAYRVAIRMQKEKR